jgi:glycerol-3-phosphate dehydrogenase
VGIQSPGLTASPALAELLVTNLAREGLGLVPRAGFDPTRRALPVHLSRRPALLSFAQAESLTKLEPGNPERMVCRCEQVRECDLAEAFSRGVPVCTVDGLKRRTRAGMGWCQGKFCRPRVARWLEDQLGTPVEPVEEAQRSGLHRVQGRDFLGLRPPSDQGRAQ